MISAGQIREIASSYLSSGDADKFVLEFSALSHNIHKNGDAQAIELANKIESKMADLRGGFISKALFIDSLRDLVDVSWVAYYFFSVGQFFNSVNQLVVPQKEPPAWVGPFGTSPVAGFGSKGLVRR